MTPADTRSTSARYRGGSPARTAPTRSRIQGTIHFLPAAGGFTESSRHGFRVIRPSLNAASNTEDRLAKIAHT